MKRILVTGSEGFIGRELISSLNSKDYEIFGIDIVEVNKDNYFKCDIRSNKLRDLVSSVSPDIVIHLAAQIDVRFSVSHPVEDLNINGIGTLNLIQALNNTNCKELIYINSGGAIYDSKNLQSHKETDAVTPTSPYGLTKNLAEGYIRIFSELNNIGWTSLALSNCYGSPKRQNVGVIFEFYNSITNGVAPKIFGEDVTRDFVHVSDVVRAIEYTIGHPKNCRINISSGKEISLKELFNKIEKKSKISMPPIIYPPRPGEVLKSSLDNKLAKKLLNWEPTVSIEEGLDFEDK